MRDGKIARCPVLMYIYTLNQTFDIQLPEQGIYELNMIREKDDIFDMMNKEVLLCKYCIENKIDWERCEQIRKLEDFIVED